MQDWFFLDFSTLKLLKMSITSNDEQIEITAFFLKFDIPVNNAVWISVVLQPPYEVTETGWGEFEVIIKIYFNDPTERPVSRLTAVNVVLQICTVFIVSSVALWNWTHRFMGFLSFMTCCYFVKAQTVVVLNSICRISCSVYC